ncbi:MAG: response regulator [Candidatus Electrothrix sp. LOE2]|jgi:DNA-binding response OmpR family regulator|nr:response regulator [Candidatus Electrothrix sp. LOE2]
MSRKNILIVDRDKDFLLELREAFIPFNNVYQLAFVSNLAKAQEILRKFTVNMVIANVRLSGESGLELLLSVRRWHAETLVVLYSGELTEEIKRSAYHSGVSAILPYPFKFEELLKVLASIFAKESGNSTVLDTIPLADLLQLIGMGHHSADIIVINAKRERGVIRIRKGNLLEAEAAGQQGVNAVTEMLSWESPTIKTCKGTHNISLSAKPVPLHDALIQAATRLDEKS